MPAEPQALYEVQPIHVPMQSILVLYLGLFLNRHIALLPDNYIPPAVTGGLICNAIVAVIFDLNGPEDRLGCQRWITGEESMPEGYCSMPSCAIRALRPG